MIPVVIISDNGSFDSFQECTDIKILVDTDKTIVMFLLWPISDKCDKIIYYLKHKKLYS